jgi:arylsulfatase A-like enzyme
MSFQPDILWIVTTQWRAQACGFAGDPNARTPWLDAFARESVNYTQAVTPHPFGPFARAAMLTGVLSPENGVRDYFDPLPVYRKNEFAGQGPVRASAADKELGGGRPPLQEKSGRGRLRAGAAGRTIAHDLGEQGYATAFFGKWHLAQRDPQAPLVGEAHAKMIVPPEARGGFEFWEGFESGFLLNDPWLHGTRLEQPTKFAGYQSDVL